MAMQQALFEAVLSEVRAQTAAVRKEAAGTWRFLRRLPPLKLANITLSGPIQPPAPMYEVVTPAGRRVADPVKLFQLLEGPRRRTFGRGQLKIV